MKEAIIERACFEYGNSLSNFFIYKIPDQRKLIGTAYKKCLMTPAGQPDLVVIHKSGLISYVELKNEKGKLSPTQELFIGKLKEFNVNVYVCRSLGEFKEVLKEIEGMVKT